MLVWERRGCGGLAPTLDMLSLTHISAIWAVCLGWQVSIFLFFLDVRRGERRGCGGLAPTLDMLSLAYISAIWAVCLGWQVGSFCCFFRC